MRARLTKDFTFEAAQILPKAPEGHKCRRMHGHSFKIEISVEGDVDPRTGWVYDHAEIGAAMKPLLKILDHTYLNQIVVNPSTLGVILDGEGEGIIPQSHLLDNAVRNAPRFDFETVRKPVDRLMVRAVYFFESMIRSRVVTQRLNITVFLVGVSVTRNIELKRATERDIQNLDASANAEDRQTARERF